MQCGRLRNFLQRFLRMSSLMAQGISVCICLSGSVFYLEVELGKLTHLISVAPSFADFRYESGLLSVYTKILLQSGTHGISLWRPILIPVIPTSWNCISAFWWWWHKTLMGEADGTGEGMFIVTCSNYFGLDCSQLLMGVRVINIDNYRLQTYSIINIILKLTWCEVGQALWSRLNTSHSSGKPNLKGHNKWRLWSCCKHEDEHVQMCITLDCKLPWWRVWRFPFNTVWKKGFKMNLNKKISNLLPEHQALASVSIIHFKRYTKINF